MKLGLLTSVIIDALKNRFNKMDPNECLRKLVVSIEGGWLDDAANHHYDLRCWLDTDGFEPRLFENYPELARSFDAGFDSFCAFVEDAEKPVSRWT